MSWQEAIAFGVVLVGLGAGAFLVAQRPAFWIGFGVLALKKLWPLVVSIGSLLLKRKTPEEEAKDHQRVRQRTDVDARGKERER